MNLTQHAAERAQQRRIPPLVVDVLLSFGRVFRRRGADVYVLDKKGRYEAERYLGRAVKQLEHYLDAYLVVGDDGAVITMGYRQRRFRRR